MNNEKLEMKIHFFLTAKHTKGGVFFIICVVWKGGIRGLINHTVFVKGHVATSEGAQLASVTHIF